MRHHMILQMSVLNTRIRLDRGLKENLVLSSRAQRLVDIGSTNLGVLVKLFAGNGVTTNLGRANGFREWTLLHFVCMDRA